MPVTSTTAQELFIGAGDLYVDGVAIGATSDQNVWRLMRTYFRPNLNGVRGPLVGTDYVQMEVAQIESTVPEISTANIALAIPGTTATVQNTSAAAAGGGMSSTVSGAHNAGDVVLNVASATNGVAGDQIMIGPAGATREFRKIVSVSTNALTLDAPLTYAHANGEAAVEVVATSLALDLAAGSVNAKVASVTGLVVGEYVLIGAPGEREVRKLTAVGTTGAAGTGITWAQPTTTRHRYGEAVIEVDGESLTRYTSTGVSRRLPTSDYHDYELRVPGLGGREARFGVLDAIMINNPEFGAQDAGNLAPRLTLESRWDPSAPGTAPWYIDKIVPQGG